MPETPELLEELFSRRLGAIASAAQPIRTPIRYFDASQSSSNYESEYGEHPRPAKLQEVPTASYRNTAPVSCDTLKANRLTESRNENAKRMLDNPTSNVKASSFKWYCHPKKQWEEIMRITSPEIKIRAF